MASERYERVWDAERKRHVRVHRLVAERMLGRPLRPGEVVHHVDGDKRNNNPENLRVLQSQQRHMVLEHLERRMAKGQLPLFEVGTLVEERGEEEVLLR
ncbi:HNH endonuclease signature motif containing protein [Deinococcus pimensis]|uniref:HNH endonuclease signature motif containing protein n=1 Tax=Deinococcus pimensis TaxID=309888 RepID=UPI0005EB5FF2|nr:HNH endonuclease signature motif containing protein [Deinococcus pimensis]